ncbi:MAG TPA: phosphoribosylamine--glycine ligase [Candidatus Thermoplasmatota archaeon]|nr:phosphoribosylamine--glycine ligase [Candidatus Thermoplasmatota archaeon]
MSEKVLVVGGGAREHAIAEAVQRSGGAVYATLKNRNPGILRLAKEHKLVDETAVSDIVAAAKGWNVDLAVLGMDAAVAAGVADCLAAAGIPTASPTRAAGEIEWSKAFMRRLLDERKVPGRLQYRIFDNDRGLARYVESLGEVAVKPIGLTGGKGVKVTGDHLADAAEATAYASEILRTGFGGESRVLVEEKVEGEEFSLQCFCDGNVAVPMPAVQDHKRAWEGDKGPNTGGMGSYSDANGLLPFMTRADYEDAAVIAQKILEALAAEGRPYVGTMYVQFMLTSDGPRVIEVNARFGDPEAMNVLSTLKTNYLDVLHAMVDGTLGQRRVAFAPEATVCKYVVPEGYGVKSAANEPLEVDEKAIAEAGARAYYAAVNERDGRLTTTTSRTVGIVACAPTLAEANERADRALAGVRGPRLFARRDIGSASLLAERVRHMEKIRG